MAITTTRCFFFSFFFFFAVLIAQFERRNVNISRLCLCSVVALFARLFVRIDKKNHFFFASSTKTLKWLNNHRLRPKKKHYKLARDSFYHCNEASTSHLCKHFNGSRELQSQSFYFWIKKTHRVKHFVQWTELNRSFKNMRTKSNTNKK